MNNKGRSVIKIVLLIVIISLVAIIAFYVWKAEEVNSKEITNAYTNLTKVDPKLNYNNNQFAINYINAAKKTGNSKLINMVSGAWSMYAGNGTYIDPDTGLPVDQNGTDNNNNNDDDDDSPTVPSTNGDGTVVNGSLQFASGVTANVNAGTESPEVFMQRLNAFCAGSHTPGVSPTHRRNSIEGNTKQHMIGRYYCWFCYTSTSMGRVRQDCSGIGGFLSNNGQGGSSTYADLPNVTSKADAHLGDMFYKDGHVRLFIGWVVPSDPNNTRYYYFDTGNDDGIDKVIAQNPDVGTATIANNKITIPYGDSIMTLKKVH